MKYPILINLIFILAFLMACDNQPDYPVVRLNVAAQGDVVAADLAPGKIPLRVAVAAVISPKATFDTYSPLLDYLARHLDRPVELLQRPTYAEINELLRTGQADVAFVCGGAFVEGEREQYMELLAIPEIQGDTTYQALLIVPATSNAQNMEDLRGQRFAFSDPLSNSGRLYVQYQLAQMGETAATFFKSTIYTYSHDNSIRAVADGIVDGATVDSLVFAALARQEPELAARLRVIERSPAFGIPPVVVHPALESEMKDALRSALLQMHQDEAGQAALAALYVDRFVPPISVAYDDIRQMAAAVRGWPEQ
ncbi:MAG: phosphate/phosphite/phosphonate ABC transporter substrate-binding protein [Aquificales bacterium]|nr:phosphate/phosphite/phosphonate ABC transporter substrate-binding protein [Aquificales bacterium]